MYIYTYIFWKLPSSNGAQIFHFFQIPKPLRLLTSQVTESCSSNFKAVEMLVFPEDVIADIISRLPVKPLLRFRCVCKCWCDLIDSPTFVKLHWDRTEKSKSHRKLISSEMYSVDFDAMTKTNFAEMYSVDFDAMTKTNIADVVVVPNPFGPVGIVNCCDGLVFLCKTDTNEFAIWNPSTRRYQILPDLDSGPLPQSSRYDTKRRLFCGLGYDVLGDDYKVLFAMQCDSDSEKSFSSEVNVYSLKSNSWKQIEPFPYYLKFGRSPGVAACGAVHCFADKVKGSGEMWIAAFDLATEEYKMMAQPKYAKDMNFYVHLESLGGCLSVTYAYLTEYVDIWVLKEYGNCESWTNITRIHSSALRGFSFGYVRSIEFSVSGKELILILQKGMNSMKRYDIEKKSAKDVEIQCQGNCPTLSNNTYQECLVQLKSGCLSAQRKEGIPNSKKIEKPKKRDKFLSKGFKLVL